MIRHIVIAAFRNMAANKLISAIAILGLAIGITAALFLGLALKGNYSHNQFIPGYARTYLVMTANDRGSYSWGSDGRFAALLKAHVPEFEAVARLNSARAEFRHGNVAALEQFYWADPEIFAVLPFPVFRGDLQSALAAPDSLTVSRSAARKYFGREDVVGQVMQVGRRPMTVKAVVEDIPALTQLQRNGIFVSVLSPDAPSFLPESRAFSQNTMTFARLKPNVPVDDVRQRVRAAAQPILASIADKTRQTYLDTPYLLPLNETMSSPKSNGGAAANLILMVLVILLLLFIASANFVNLWVARAARRKMEVGVRKVCGASRRMLIQQFLGESVITVFLATCVALAMAEWLVPLGNAAGLVTAPLDYWRNPPLLITLLLGVVVLGVLAGAYPALLLSSARPVTVMNGLMGRIWHAGIIRNGLVALQFCILLIFLIGAVVTYQQYRFAQQISPKEQIANVMTIWDACRPAFRAALERSPDVSAVTCSGGEIMWAGALSSVQTKGGEVRVSLIRADTEMYGFYGMKPLAGTLSGPARSLVIDQTAVTKLGFASAQAAIGQFIATSGVLAGLPVTAVVPDFTLRPTQYAAQATIFVPIDMNVSESTSGEPTGQMLSIRVKGAAHAEIAMRIESLWAASGGSGQFDYQFLDDEFQRQDAGVQAGAFIIGGLACIAMLLACMGLTGLSIANAERRTKEIGIRSAMGATTGRIIILLLFEFAKPVLWAMLLAWPLAWWGMRMLLGMFARQVPLQLWVFVAASLATLLIALLSVAVHAFRAARAKPVLALRYE